jgi:hypothetical protein
MESGSNRKSVDFRCKGSFPSAVHITHRKREARAFPPEPSASRHRPPRPAAMGCLSRRPAESELHLQSYAPRKNLAIGAKPSLTTTFSYPSGEINFRISPCQLSSDQGRVDSISIATSQTSRFTWISAARPPRAKKPKPEIATNPPPAVPAECGRVC